MELIVDLLVTVLELMTIKFLQKLSRVYLPAAFYFTSVLLIPGLTSGRIAVEYPRNSMNIAWGRRKWIDKSPQGKTTLSPALGELAGLVFWVAAAGLALLLYRPLLHLTR
jgi:hypothetical protein